jgi:hypothetical protein
MVVSVLAWLEGASQGVLGLRFDLGADPIRLGRSTSCAIQLSDPLVSREHAEIRPGDGGFVVVDLGSTHGTRVDGVRVGQATLAHGSRLQVGATEFVFRLPQEAIPTAMFVETPRAGSVPSAPAAPLPQPPPSAPAAPEAPRPPAPRAAAKAPSAPPRPSRRLLIGCGAAFVLGLCCCVSVYLASRFGVAPSGWDSIGDDGSSEITPEDVALALEVPLPDERGQVLERLGRPDEFDISVVQIEGGQVRLETWSYHSLGMRVDFADGAIAWTVGIEPASERTVFPAWYDPTAFETGMTIAEASALASAASPAGTVPMRIDLAEGGDDLAGGEMLLGDQIMLGFQDGSLVFVETVGATLQESGG